MEETAEGTELATMAVAEAVAAEVTGAALAIMAEETATALVEVQAAVDLALPGTMQTRTPSLMQETSVPSAPAPLSPVRPIAGGFSMGQHRVSAQKPLRKHTTCASNHSGRSTPLLPQG
jgi:hypothetical protein